VRGKVIAGNWKMNNDAAGAENLVNGIKQLLTFELNKTRVVVCPPFPSLQLVQSMIGGTQIELGAQNMHFENEGAYTGEVSAGMLKSVGCTYVILGHSERRQYFGETNALINMKAKKALASGLTPIVCVGETLEEREQNITDQVVTAQVKGVLKDIPSSDIERVIIAYEPVWAIGTGKNATPAQAEDVHRLIRKLISQLHGWAVADKVVIQYGGSVKPDNAAELLRQADIDGALVGGACLKAESFVEIIKASVAS
jgi:triosephosphate isomerase